MVNKINPINPNATVEANNLLNLLWRYTNEREILSGAFDILVNSEYPQGNHYDTVSDIFGIKPALYSTRYYWTGSGFALSQEDSQNGAWCTRRINDVLQRHYEEGAILLVHADSSKLEYLGNMLESKKLVSSLPGVSIHKKFINGIVYLDKSNGRYDREVGGLFWEIAAQWADAFEDLEKRGIRAYIFRPFLEMNSKRFFGDCPEGHEAFKNVWRQMCDYFYNERSLNGCLLAFAPADYTYLQLSAHAFYPGDEYVDILAPTVYPSEEGIYQKPTESNYEWMKDAQKPFGLSEFSVRTGNWRVAHEKPPGDWAAAVKVVQSDYPKTAFINAWSGNSYSLLPYDKETGAGNHGGKDFFINDYMVNLKEINGLYNTD